MLTFVHLYVAARELAVHNATEDCSFLNIFPVQLNDNEAELRELLRLNIVPRGNQIDLRELRIDVRELGPL